ncbi:hemerythrin [Mariprofundus ferrinatatus]|uniref:Hemerythrin n=1 Tax=Mariprofundus ferrinatatus TaxID=1921087 RepID=A0A2K8L485_9PROT|nr:hemerythrin family protein [Mariprofundus ferrinatatus]ATX81049.1 hemerythrin [Mariprofundus ferrinatatus]
MTLYASDLPEVPFRAMHDVHLEEVEMINAIDALIEDLEAGDAAAYTLDERLAGLLAHTKAHFSNEERLMLEARFPPYPVHKGAHDLFLRELEAAIADWNATHRIVAIAAFMRGRLPDWMKDHIGSMDFVTARFLAMRE